MIGYSAESKGSSSKERPSALMRMAGMTAKSMKQEVLNRAKALSTILITCLVSGNALSTLEAAGLRIMETVRHYEDTVKLELEDSVRP